MTLFFKSWVSNTPAAYTAMLACLIVLAVFYEWLGVWNRRREVELAAQWKSQVSLWRAWLAGVWLAGVWLAGPAQFIFFCSLVVWHTLAGHR